MKFCMEVMALNTVYCKISYVGKIGILVLPRTSCLEVRLELLQSETAGTLKYDLI
jgi:hypothetical protein